MNERIRELAYRAKLDEHMLWTNAGMKLPDDMIKFAELIVQECIAALDENDGATHHRELLFTHFGVTEHKGWVCSKCGVDRTKAVCPKGYTAALTGECPMTGTTQSGVTE